jgi:hypothetical protein
MTSRHGVFTAYASEHGGEYVWSGVQRSLTFGAVWCGCRRGGSLQREPCKAGWCPGQGREGDGEKRRCRKSRT